jgi:5'-3' exonuclease
MKFTVQIESGLCNVLKSFVTALSIGDANILPRVNHRFDADYREILDDSLICHGPHEFGESFISARLLILKSEEAEQPDLINDAKKLGRHPDIVNQRLITLFSKHTIDWFYDRALICDKVFDRIQSGIKKIIWKNVHAFVKDLAKNEHTFLLSEYTHRNKMDGRKWSNENNKERENLLTNVPMIYRAEEKYICPQETYWESRYYQCLFDNKNDESFINSISTNYLEGLEWVYKYYTLGCPDWKWKYNHHYPPLLVDLVKYFPNGDNHEFIKPDSITKPFSAYAQLSYVLPRDQLRLLPRKIREYLLKNYADMYETTHHLQWAFCKYLWEAHILTKTMDAIHLEKLENEILCL